VNALIRPVFLGKVQHVLYDSCGMGAGTMNGFQELGNVPFVHEVMDGRHGGAGFHGNCVVYRQIHGKAVFDDLGILHHGSKGVVDLVCHACCKPPDGDHLFRLDEHPFHIYTSGYIVNSHYYSLKMAAGKGIGRYVFIYGTILCVPDMACY